MLSFNLKKIKVAAGKPTYQRQFPPNNISTVKRNTCNDKKIFEENVH